MMSRTHLGVLDLRYNRPRYDRDDSWRVATRSTIPELSAAVLAGGQSRRMGVDKALVEFDGRPMLEHTISVLRLVSDDVFVVGDRAPYHGFGAPVFADSHPGSGPLGGIATALEHARSNHVLVVACDMPFLNPTLLRALASEDRDYDVLVPVVSVNGVPVYQMLHSIYSRYCLTAIESQLEARDLAVSGLAKRVKVRMLDEVWIRTHDPWLRSFMNANTPGEIDAARREKR